jgi:hypothetical protein
MPDIGLISNGEPLSADYTHRRHDNCKRGRRIKEVKVSHKNGLPASLVGEPRPELPATDERHRFA